MRCFTLLILVFALPFLFADCAAKKSYIMQAHGTIEDTEFMAMYGPEGANDLPETGIVVKNNTGKDIIVKLEGKFIKTIIVLCDGTSSAALPPGTYKYTISVKGGTEARLESGERTVREKCRYIFNVFLEDKIEE